MAKSTVNNAMQDVQDDLALLKSGIQQDQNAVNKWLDDNLNQ